jgi:hypothetical protein
MKVFTFGKSSYNMLSFSQRKGLKPIRTIIQLESADVPLRNQLWNGIVFAYWDKADKYSVIKDDAVGVLLKQLWVHYYELRIDDILQHPYEIIEKVKKDFLNGSWYEMYDLLQFMPNRYREEPVNTAFIKYSNQVLTKYLSGYRFTGKLLVDITSEEEIKSIETALEDTDGYKAVQSHFKRALELYSDRSNPDYRNSIKESISAVESYCCIITNKPKATLGQALAEIEKSHEVHPALKASFSSLYGWTSDADGIRHKMLEQSNVKQEDAKFMLVACTAFVNYLIAKNIPS